MSKTSKRAITLFVIATMVLSMLSAFIAVPVMAAPGDITPIIAGDGDTTWSTTEAKYGVWSYELDSGTGGGVGRIFIEITPILLQDLLDDPTFWLWMPEDYVSGGSYDEATDFPQGTDYHPFGIPYINICLDLSGNGIGTYTGTYYDDKLEALGSSDGGATVGDLGYRADAPTAEEWTKMQEAWGYYDMDNTMGSPYGAWPIVIGTLAEWQTYMLGYDALAEVRGVEITHGYWDPASGDDDTVYVDDMKINGVTYPIEKYVAPGDDFSIDAIWPEGTVDYGDTLTVLGSGVTGGSTVELYWDFVTAANSLGVTTGLSSGEFDCDVKVPSTYYGDHYIWGKDLTTGLTTMFETAVSVVPLVKLSPTSGLEEDDVIVKGYGFLEDSDIDITFTGAEVIALPGEEETDENGYFEYSFEVGEVGDGDYYVWATDDDDNDDDAKFVVGASISLDKTVGPAGSLVKVDGYGFTAGIIETEVDITMDGFPVDTKDGEDIIVTDSGLFTAYIIIPSVEIDDYDIIFIDGADPVDASFEVDGETAITVMPGHGTPGTALTVKGYNFTQISGTEVLLELEERDVETTTDSNGEFEAIIVIPPCDIGDRYYVTATDDKNCYAEEEVLVTIIFLQLSDLAGPVGSAVTLMGSGFTDGLDDGEWNATFGDLELFLDADIDDGQTYFSDTFHVPSLPSGTYKINVRDIVEEIVVGIDFTITEQAALSVNRAEIPNGYNLTIEGVNFAEYIGDVEYETTWGLYNSTDAWDLNDYPNVTISIPGAAVPVTSLEEDEESTFTGYYLIPEFLELGSYTINCTTVTNADTDPELTQYAEVDIEIVPEEVVLNIGGPSYARGQTITFVIKATLQKSPFSLGIKDPEGSEVFNSTWELKHWKTLGTWYYIPSNLQIDKNTEWLYTLPADAMSGTWTYSFWDDDKEYANGTFQVTQLTEIEQLQVDIGEIISGIEGMGASNTELAALVADLQGASAEAVAAAAAAAAAAGDAQTAAEAAMAAISDVDDTAGDALTAANDAKDAADRAKDAADLGLQAAMDAVAKAQESVDAATDAKEAAEDNKRQTGGLTTLVYGAIAASLIAALAAIVSLMQISRRIAG